MALPTERLDRLIMFLLPVRIIFLFSVQIPLSASFDIDHKGQVWSESLGSKELQAPTALMRSAASFLPRQRFDPWSRITQALEERQALEEQPRPPVMSDDEVAKERLNIAEDRARFQTERARFDQERSHTEMLKNLEALKRERQQFEAERAQMATDLKVHDSVPAAWPSGRPLGTYDSSDMLGQVSSDPLGHIANNPLDHFIESERSKLEEFRKRLDEERRYVAKQEQARDDLAKDRAQLEREWRQLEADRASYKSTMATPFVPPPLPDDLPLADSNLPLADSSSTFEPLSADLNSSDVPLAQYQDPTSIPTSVLSAQPSTTPSENVDFQKEFDKKVSAQRQEVSAQRHKIKALQAKLARGHRERDELRDELRARLESEHEASKASNDTLHHLEDMIKSMEENQKTMRKELEKTKAPIVTTAAPTVAPTVAPQQQQQQQQQEMHIDSQQQQQQQQQQQRQHSRAESSAKSRSPGGAEGPELSEPALNSNFRYAARQLSEAQSAQQSSDQVPQVRTISRSSGERQGLVRSRSETLPVGLEDNHRHPPSDYLPPSKNQEGIDSILHKANVETDVVYIDKGSQVIWRALNEELLQLGQRCELAETHLRQRTKDLLAVQLELEHTNAENADLRVQLHTVQKQRHGAYAKIHADRDALDQRCKKAETDLAHRASELLILKKELVHSSAVRSSLCAELEALKEHGQCVICLSEAATHVVVPCGHQALCRACATQDMQSCPVCRQPVHALIRVYRP